jgi:hypothetical protein
MRSLIFAIITIIEKLLENQSTFPKSRKALFLSGLQTEIYHEDIQNGLLQTG